jgi:phenylacetate-coenzyme A ligase PaaK-like adenylate-forming protein
VRSGAGADPTPPDGGHRAGWPWNAGAALFGLAHRAELAIDGALGAWLPAAEIARRQSARLRALLAFARREVPLYRRLRARVSEDAPLAGHPVLTKDRLMRDLRASLSDPALTQSRIEAFLREPCHGQLLDGRYAVWTSSGSTGAPAVFVHDREALAVYDALEACRARGRSAPAAWGATLLAGQRYAMLAATGGHFSGVATLARMRAEYPWLAGVTRAISLLQPLPALLREVADFDPTLLATYPTAAALLADAQCAGQVRLQLRELWLGGETLTPVLRARLQQVFGCPVRQSYGASEFLPLAFECGDGRLHVNADWAILEPVDRQYRPVPAGTASATVLLTNLANRAQPLIRYDLGDSVTVEAAPCRCGCALPAVSVQGRADDVLTLPQAGGGLVSLLPLVLQTVLEEDAHLDDYQLVQQAPDRLLLRLGPTCHGRATVARQALQAFVANQGADPVRIDIDVLDMQACRPSGKRRRIVRAPAVAG